MPLVDQPVGEHGALGAAAAGVLRTTEFLRQEGHKGDDAVLAKVHELGDKLKAARLRVQVDARRCRPAAQRRESRTSEVSTIEQAVEAAGAGGWERMPWATLGEEGEARPAEHAVTVRCLVAEDGSVPDADDAPGNVAVAAHAD